MAEWTGWVSPRLLEESILNSNLGRANTTPDPFWTVQAMQPFRRLAQVSAHVRHDVGTFEGERKSSAGLDASC